MSSSFAATTSLVPNTRRCWPDRFPWTTNELADLSRLAVKRTNGVVFGPRGPYVAEWKDLHVEGWSTFCKRYTYNVCPPTDDQPFFFNMRRPSSLFNPPPNAPEE